MLLHELIHIQRMDPAVRALANLLQIAWFFHPLVWWVGHRLGEERERACDDAVVRRLRGQKRTYMRGLLRLVEERVGPAWDASGLRMAASRRPLARRLARMLRPRYDPHPPVGAFALAALVVGVGLGLTLSTEARMAASAQVEQEPRIHARPESGSVRSSPSLSSGSKIPKRWRSAGTSRSGDHRPPMKPDAVALAARSPALFERLVELGRLSATVIVARDGMVRRVEFMGDVAEDLRSPFLEALEAARFDPTMHFERGPVPVEVRVDYYVNPPEPRRSLYQRGQALVGAEAAELLGGGREGRPRYAVVVEKGQPPVLDVGGEELIFSFVLSTDAGGDVASAELFRDSRAGLTGDSESTPVSERLIRYLRTFRFEPTGGGVAATDPPTLVIDLRVSPRGVEVATRAGDEEELERRLANSYRLADGRNLDLRPPPHAPERMLLYRTGHPLQARAVPAGPSQMTVVWTDDGPRFRGACFGCEDLESVLQTLGVRRDAVRFEGGAENVRIVADIVTREGASREELLGELSRVLDERFDLDLAFRSAIRGFQDARPAWLDRHGADGRRTAMAGACCTSSPTAGIPGPMRAAVRSPLPATSYSSWPASSACPSSTGRAARPSIRSTFGCTLRPSGRNDWAC